MFMNLYELPDHGKGPSGSGTRDQPGRPHQGHVRQGAADRVGLGEAAANLHEARRLQDPVTTDGD